MNNGTIKELIENNPIKDPNELSRQISQYLEELNQITNQDTPRSQIKERYTEVRQLRNQLSDKIEKAYSEIIRTQIAIKELYIVHKDLITATDNLQEKLDGA